MLGSSGRNSRDTTDSREGAPQCRGSLSPQVSYGGSGKITKSKITGNECDNVNCGNSTEDLAKSQSTGVLFYLEAKGSSVSDSEINENDIGAYQLAEKEENKPWATIASNTMTGHGL